jgi:DNA modification methylase
MSEPYYQDSLVTIYNADCREMAFAFDGSPCMVTDPPYGHGERWQGGTWASNPMYADALKWDRAAFDNETLCRMVKRCKASIIWGGNYYTLPPSRCWLAWEKSSRMPTLADFELAWTSLDRPAKAYREDRNPDGQRLHPTQKPLNLMQWCIGFLPAGDIVDPFAGSGTTLLAAKNLGRRAVGIEVSEKYCEIAAERCRQETLWGAA